MRLGEIVTAGVLALLSIYMMWKSTELNIGYVQGTGPGGGAWPFWLSAIMLVCTVLIAINWYRRHVAGVAILRAGARRRGAQDVPSGRRRAFRVHRADRDHLDLRRDGAVPVLLRLVSGTPQALARGAAVASRRRSIFFFFFEGLMRITMPKGLSFTEPFFNVLYEIIY